VIVGHGNLAECMMDAVEGILGKQTGWAAVSNTGMGLKELSEAVARAIEELSKDYDVIVFSDMPGGSCHHVCRELVGMRPDVRTVTGLNLMMLLEFFVKRERTELKDLVDLVRERGRESVRLI